MTVLSPTCPRCGQPPAIALSGQYWCGTEGCRVLTWNPHEDAATFEANAQIVDLPGLSWPCMVCGDVRPDAQISVVERALDGVRHPNVGPFRVRYCNDRPACVAYATADGPWTGRPALDETGAP